MTKTDLVFLLYSNGLFLPDHSTYHIFLFYQAKFSSYIHMIRSLMGRGPDPEILGFLKMWERVTSSPTVLQTYYVLNQDFNELSHDLTKSNYRNSSNRLNDFGLPCNPAVTG